MKELRYVVISLAVSYLCLQLIFIVSVKTRHLDTKGILNGVVVQVENHAVDHQWSVETNSAQSKKYVAIRESFRRLYSEMKQKARAEFSAGYWHNQTRSACKSLNMATDLSEGAVDLAALVDDKHKVIICHNAKAGSSYVAKVFAILLGQDPAKNPSDVNTDRLYSEYMVKQSKLNWYSYEEKLEKIRNYYSAMIVREPFSRLLSAYRDKIERPTNDFYVKRALQMRGNMAGTTTFKEFISYLTRRYKRIHDPHWKPYYEACSPCEMDYDFVAKVETIDEDMKHIYEEINVTDIIFPPNPVKQKTDAHLVEYYRTVPKRTLWKLYQRYKPDFEIFNYSIPEVIKAMMWA